MSWNIIFSRASIFTRNFFVQDQIRGEKDRFEYYRGSSQFRKGQNSVFHLNFGRISYSKINILPFLVHLKEEIFISPLLEEIHNL